ncbi:MAG: hypothetical protein CFH34_00917 [Alphaproteobacteria bacterium MarineAlpha9_Bin4]|nr:MAG: hypothetical protein CFH34_00917 [Alphaproteobacteria bacterium MarineAlpha9_Bin4]|tara:strand:+ start:27 stop:524 length:498 start_codon:yes stop_codon:yes gene_type:complete
MRYYLLRKNASFLENNIIVKFFLTIFLSLFIFSALAEDLVIDIRGYYKNDEIVMQNENKLVHYESKGNWNDNSNNYGKFKCKGSLLINKSGKRTDNELILCELEDVDGEYIWFIPKRSDSEWEAGVGKTSITSATKKYENLIGKTCVYAVTYYKDTFHTKTKCRN